jgi:hypothetical protein
MKTYAYTLNCGQYVLTIDGVPQTAPADTIAIGFDKEDGTLHKHGTPHMVSQWSVTTTGKLGTVGLHELADNLVVVDGRFPLEEVNKCLSISGYCKVFFEKLQRGEIEGLSYEPEPQTSNLVADMKPGS